MQGIWHTIAILPLPKLPPFVPIDPSGMDDLDDISDDLFFWLSASPILTTFATLHH
jgi:hypothetical protein